MELRAYARLLNLLGLPDLRCPPRALVRTVPMPCAPPAPRPVRGACAFRPCAVDGRRARAPGVHTPGEMPPVQLPAAHAGTEAVIRTSGAGDFKPPPSRFAAPASENPEENFCYSANRRTPPALR
ncbi:hypothetical protein Sspor_52850 [Streptomyces spororaveus]|uniref:Uncharacterized protein n=1 Tax=Streptomyces spororaveus TaxID=284039 RepID=A0ABQ3TH53_9ACTN|nr:hypothetical protein Sspor_52850 [Streptomyces spororaveus]